MKQLKLTVSDETYTGAKILASILADGSVSEMFAAWVTDGLNANPKAKQLWKEQIKKHGTD